MFLERTQLSRSSERREWAGDWKLSPRGGRGWRYPWGRGLSRPPLVLGKAGPGPLLPRGEEVQGSWGLLALGWPGASRVLGPKESRLLGLLEVGWDATKPQQDSRSAGPLPSPPPLA